MKCGCQSHNDVKKIYHEKHFQLKYPVIEKGFFYITFIPSHIHVKYC
jgi:hypothetical protein